MISFALLPMPVKTVIATVLFLSATLGVCTCILTGRKQGAGKLAMCVCITCVFTAMLILYASVIPAERAKAYIPPISNWFSNLPILYPAVVYFLSAGLLLYVIRLEIRRLRTTIGVSSVKESFDRLGTGLCFSYPNGLILLTNHKMNELAYALFDRPLQNALLFWEALSKDAPLHSAVRLSSGEQPAFRLSDGSVFSFRRETADGVIQITAADVTRQHQLMEELRVRNGELEKLNERIRAYGEKVNEYVQARERLETRVNLHGALGQALIMTRHSLETRSGDRDRIVELWKRNVDVLRMEAAPAPEADSFQSLINAAEAIGMKVRIEGAPPKRQAARKLMAAVGAEALTNAVRHAGAKRLTIEIEETSENWIARYTNDGRPPEGPVREGGGLLSARKKAEAVGGEIAVAHAPEFCLSLFIRKEVNEDV